MSSINLHNTLKKIKNGYMHKFLLALGAYPLLRMKQHKLKPFLGMLLSISKKNIHKKLEIKNCEHY